MRFVFRARAKRSESSWEIVAQVNKKEDKVDFRSSESERWS